MLQVRVLPEEPLRRPAVRRAFGIPYVAGALLEAPAWGSPQGPPAEPAREPLVGEGLLEKLCQLPYVHATIALPVVPMALLSRWLAVSLPCSVPSVVPMESGVETRARMAR